MLAFTSPAATAAQYLLSSIAQCAAACFVLVLTVLQHFIIDELGRTLGGGQMDGSAVS
jgi:hypothetical protein